MSITIKLPLNVITKLVNAIDVNTSSIWYDAVIRVGRGYEILLLKL